MKEAKLLKETSSMYKLLKFIESSMYEADNVMLYQKTDEQAVIYLNVESFYCVTKWKRKIIAENILYDKQRINKKITFKVDVQKLQEALNLVSCN